MRGLTSTIAGVCLLAASLWIFWHGGSTTTVVITAVGSLLLLYRGYQGLTITEAAGDAMFPIELATNPRGAILDLAVDQVTDLFAGSREKTAEPAEEDRTSPAGTDRSFDPDAIIARHMENRAEHPPASDRPASQGRTFGRKGL